MIEHAVGILRLLLGEIMLPVVIGHLAIGDVTLDGEPVVCEGKRPVLRQRQAHLRHRTGVDTQGLATAAQGLVLQFQGILLGANAQHAMEPTSLHEGLLHHHMTGVMERHSHIHPIADAPPAGGIGIERTNRATTEITIGLLQRTESVLVGIEPERSLALGERALHLHVVMYVLAEVELARFGTFLPSILGRRCERQRQQEGKEHRMSIMMYHSIFSNPRIYSSLKVLQPLLAPWRI